MVSLHPPGKDCTPKTRLWPANSEPWVLWRWSPRSECEGVNPNEMPAVKFKELSTPDGAEPSAKIQERVIAARKIQIERFAKEKKIFVNAHMQTRHLKKHCSITSAGQNLLRAAMSRLGLSARTYDRILKVARTIADLESSPDIKESHLSEVIQYRTLDWDLWM